MLSKKEFDAMLYALEQGTISEEQREELKPYKVRNAIILAAGFASRCAPLSYEKPKGLFIVKGEVLIERQIRQLQEKGITDIYVVVGYMKELFYYLEDEFNVHIISNPEYYKKNNLSSVYAAKQFFGNSYICYSDNYSIVNNYMPYVYQSYFAAQYSEGYTNEYVIEADTSGRIKQYYIGGEHSWYQMGEMYFTNEVASQFLELLEKEYTYPNIVDMKIDDFFIRHLASLEVYVKFNNETSIYEFDTIAEIEKFDSQFFSNIGDSILANINNALQCKNANITNVNRITKGNTNIIFKFDYDGQSYVYRHPGIGSERIIDREKELIAMQKAAELRLDPTLIKCDPLKGWKLSRYIENIDFDYENINDEKRGIEIIRRLHSGPVKHKLGWELNMLKRATEIQAMVPKAINKAHKKFDIMRKEITKLYNFAKADGYEIEMSHNDCCDTNILLGKKETYLIDWEYAGDNDPSVDIATFIIGCKHTHEEVDRILEIYFQRPLSRSERRHFYAFIAISAYFYFSWGLYEESIGKDVGELTYIWYKYAIEYGKIALLLYSEEENIL